MVGRRDCKAVPPSRFCKSDWLVHVRGADVVHVEGRILRADHPQDTITTVCSGGAHQKVPLKVVFLT
jgi:hypothetical protein